MHTTPAFGTASAHARARSKVRSTGFSQNTCFFCAADFMIRSACVSVLEQITVAPIDASPIAPSISATCAPYCAASAAAASRFTSTTYLSRTPGCRARLDAWILPMRPAPNTATSIVLPATSVIVSSSVCRLFYVQFQLVRERDEQRLAQANRAGQRAECKRAALFHIQLRARITRERRQLAIRNDERLCLRSEERRVGKECRSRW